jgi:hypothetical protein
MTKLGASMLRRQRKRERQATQLARLLVTIDNVAAERRTWPLRRPGRALLGRG